MDDSLDPQLNTQQLTPHLTQPTHDPSPNSWHAKIPSLGNTKQPEILLTSINAGYIHANLGLRYLMANLGDLEPRACMLEATRRLGNDSLVQAIVDLNPRILGLSVSIWNHLDSIALLTQLRLRLPKLVIILGGPEVSYLPQDQELFRYAHFLLRGEAELLFARLCRFILSFGTFRLPKKTRIFQGTLPDLTQVQLPYRLLSQDDLTNRMLYIETSRGCPFRCEFCLSSIQGAVRFFPLEPVLQEIQNLYNQGGRYFKVIDRTFNINIQRAQRTLEFFLELFTGNVALDDQDSAKEPGVQNPGSYVQFEVVPDRLPQELRHIIQKYPPDTLRLEVGIQTYNNEVAARINRRQDQQATQDNLEFLLKETNAIIHADLIIGLPGEDLDSFAQGFDRLWLLGPDEIQLGILKALPGTTLHRHDPEFGMVYSPAPPYEILETQAIPKEEMDRLKRAAKYWELVVNRGRFPELVQKLLPRGEGTFLRFLELSDELYKHFGKTWGIDAQALGQTLERFL